MAANTSPEPAVATAVVTLLQQLVRIDSRNVLPLAKTGERPADERALCRFLRLHLERLGFTCRVTEVAPHRPNLVAEREVCPGRPFLAFEAHMDTVGDAGMTIAPFDPIIADGRVHGRGACDTKGSLAAMLTAVACVVRENLAVNLMVIATCAEETGCEGAPFLDLDPRRIAGAIIGEPTLNRPVTAHKANACFELVCHGTAAHGACPDCGVNAIYRAADLLSFLRHAIIPELAAHPHPRFSGSTLSVNLVHGGTKANIVPDCCALTCDLRLVPGAGDISRAAEILADRASRQLGFPVALGWQHVTPGLDTDWQHPFARVVDQALQAAGVASPPGVVTYCTDGGVLAAKGIPCIVLGPGDIRQAHGAVEYIAVEQLHEAVALYTAIARAAARSTMP